MAFETPEDVCKIMISILNPLVENKYNTLEHKKINTQFKKIFDNTNICSDAISIITEYTNDPIKLFDPCYGTGRLVKKIQNKFNNIIYTNNVYGFEIDSKFNKIKYLQSSNNEIFNNIKFREFLHEHISEKFNIITTDPPFGKKIRLYSLKCIFGTEYNNMFPLKTNRVELLVLQKCLYHLKENGILQIIFPIYITWKKKIMNWLKINYNIKSIIEISINDIKCVILTIVNNKSK